MKFNLLWTLGALSLVMSSSSFAQDDVKAQKGERIYNNYCYTCHGEDLVNSGQSFDLRKLKVTETLKVMTSNHLSQQNRKQSHLRLVQVISKT